MRKIKLPKEVLIWLIDHKAWLVGSAVGWYLGETDGQPRDLDIVVPPDEWQAVTRTIPKDITIRLNTFGGLKFTLEGFEIDMWPAHLENFFEIAASHKKGTKALRLRPYCLVADQS